MLQGKKILLGITGSIAAYKAAILIRLLIKEGAEVKVIMTTAAKSFISPLTLSTLSKNPVLTELFDNQSWANHVMLGRWADMMIIAPASCNTLAKMSNGMCDNLLLAVYLSAVCPVMIAPAMDEDMWRHQSTIDNIKRLHSYGNIILPVDNGELASGLYGDGRMAEPEVIIKQIALLFDKQYQLKGKKVIITAGPTYEAIDPVRFIGNHSSGKMGIAIAESCKSRGAEVTLVIGPTTQELPSSIKVVRVDTAAEMFDITTSLFPQHDIALLCAAVADYRVADPATEKIKKNGETLTLTLERTSDILKTLGDIKMQHQIVVGFALETNNEIENAQKKLADKKADFIVLNSLKDPNAGFGHDTNKVIVFEKGGKQYDIPAGSKKQVASDLIDTIITYKNA